MFVDIEKGTLLEMTTNNKKETLVRTIKSFEGYDTNIKVVTIDMSGGYYSMLQEILPNAKVVIDKYHVIQDLGRYVNATKKAIVERIKEEIREITDETERKEKERILSNALKNTYLFKYREEQMPKSSLACLVDVCENFPLLNTLRLLKSGFHHIYDCSNWESARACYDIWAKSIPKDTEFDEMRKFKKTVDRWIIPIFNYFAPDCRYTNAATEGINNLVDLIEREGRGYSFEILRYKCLFHPKVKDRPKFGRKDIPKYYFNEDINNYIRYDGLKGWNDVYAEYEMEEVLLPNDGADMRTLMNLLESEKETFL